MNVCLNGDFFPAETPLLPVHNRSYKWGDGVFETMKVFRGKILLEDLHFERLFLSLNVLVIGNNLQIEILREKIIYLCEKNCCLDLARVRLAVFRDEASGQSDLPTASEASREVDLGAS